jgi:CheY-like chemotaxis protein
MTLKQRLTEDNRSVKPHPHILVVDDDKSNAFVMGLHLDQYNCTYDTASNAEQALSMLGKNTYDILLLDVRLPDMDGFELVKIIREQEQAGDGCRKKIIAVTALAYLEDRNRCLEAGMDDYISKPFTDNVLRAKLGVMGQEARS